MMYCFVLLVDLEKGFFFEKMKKKNKHCLYRIENYEGCESDLAQAMIFAEELRELTDEYQSEKRLEREDECNIFMAKLVLETDTFLNENSDAHEAIAKALLQHGILAGKQINDIAEKVIQSRTSDYKSPLEKLQSRL